ncbi:hypothetical protein DLJ53_12555 [Acuticoccus sediminis]|uniref:IclR family transcriptional regulator n=1 Tax=Acuticoccus sediminis TaxID=2184697 RepID=A0A8B2NTC3_9HYPH|nr:IclR family transcriptional regulator [Acuticoccus sediminis]RAI02191.1 hypothetical protein DLJ53_12555 [Acuticoccus sediminis]
MTSAPGPIERYLQILELVAASPRGLNLGEIAEITALPKASVHRLTRALMDAGALTSDDAWRKTFVIGERMWRILQLGQSQEDVTAFAQLVVDDLAAELHETCYIVRLGFDAITSVARAVPDQGHSIHVFPGEEQPAHAAASAKAILAFQPAEVVARHLAAPLAPLTRFTHTSAEAVCAELEEVRRTGFAICIREIDENVGAYAAPVPTTRGGIVYSIGVTGPMSRLTERTPEAWADLLRPAAARFARMLETSEGGSLGEARLRRQPPLVAAG